MKTTLLLLCLFLVHSSFASTQDTSNCEKENNQTKSKKLYTYQALIALSFPNSAYDSISIDKQCDALGGKIVSRASRDEAYSVYARAAVCKIPVSVDE